MIEAALVRLRVDNRGIITDTVRHRNRVNIRHVVYTLACMQATHAGGLLDRYETMLLHISLRSYINSESILKDMKQQAAHFQAPPKHMSVGHVRGTRAVHRYVCVSLEIFTHFIRSRFRTVFNSLKNYVLS